MNMWKIAVQQKIGKANLAAMRGKLVASGTPVTCQR